MTNEILINEEEFDKAVFKVAEMTSENSNLRGMEAFATITTGMFFASQMKKFLFGKGEKDAKQQDKESGL